MSLLRPGVIKQHTTVTFLSFVFLCLTGTSEDYRLLEQMNKATITKYVEMKSISANITRAMKELNEKCTYICLNIEVDEIYSGIASDKMLTEGLYTHTFLIM